MTNQDQIELATKVSETWDQWRNANGILIKVSISITQD